MIGGDAMYWAAAPGVEGVSQNVLDTHEQLMLTADEFCKYNEHLRMLGADARAFREDWHVSEYTTAKLELQGFTRLTNSTIGLVEDGAGKFVIVFVYTIDVDVDPLIQLSEYALSKDDKVKHKHTAGQSLVNKRGSKLQSGRMLMYGSKPNFGQNSAKGANRRPHPSVYVPNGRIDSTLNGLVRNLASHCATMEALATPPISALRWHLANAHDSSGAHRMSGDCAAFSLSLTSSYVVQPHDDSGVANEFVLFANRTGDFPKGHEWMFVVAGCLLALPNTIRTGVMITLPGSNVYHGTLPTSSTSTSLCHGNVGCALVTRKEFIEACIAQTARGESTEVDSGPAHTASVLYNC